MPSGRAKTSLLSAVLLLAQTASGASTLRGFPLHLQDTVELGPPLAFDLDGDGQSELVVVSNNKLHVYEADGNPVKGFPLTFEGRQDAPATAAAAGILTVGSGNKLPVVVFGTKSKKLVAIDVDGKQPEGFPVSLGAKLAGPPALADLGGSQGNEIVCGTKDGKIHVYDYRGRSLPGYPASCGEAVATAVTVGRFGGHDRPVLLFGDEKGRLHAWRKPAKQLPGFPFKARYTISSQPVLGDIDDNGEFEVIFGSKDFKVYALKANAEPVSGFPLVTGYRVYSSPALADLDGDGVVEVIVSGGDGKLYARGMKGKPGRGFPRAVGRRLKASAVAGDIDRDGRVEIAVGTDKSRLALYRSNGKRYPGFPKRLDDSVAVAPLLVDLDGDGLIEIVVVTRVGTLYAFKMIRKGDKGAELAWPAEARDSRRSATTYPNPPRYGQLAISPGSPLTADDLRLDYRFFDLDGDPEPGTLIRWFRNGKPVPGFDGARKVPSSATRKHEKWHFGLRASPSGRLFESPPVEVANTPPGSPAIDIEPDPARCSDELKLEITTPSADADGDRVRYRVTWLRDKLPFGKWRKKFIPSKQVHSGQRWTVIVVSDDGEARGAPVRSSIVISNSVPTAPKVRLKPTEPKVVDKLEVIIASPGRDPDGDQVSYRYLWRAGEEELNLPLDARILPAGIVKKHSKIGVEVTSFDGTEQGGKTFAETKIANTPPSAPAVRIMPDSPRTGDDLQVEIVDAAEDADKDCVSYLVSWRPERRSASGESIKGLALPCSSTKKGQKWLVEVVPHDGESSGKAARAECSIGNTAPLAPAIAAADARPFTTGGLLVKLIEPARDPDGDELTIDVTWYGVSGGKGKRKQIARGQGLFELPASRTRKNTRYVARVAASDGQDQSRVVSQWFEVRNSPPGECAVEIRPAAPVSGQDLKAVITRDAPDADGDDISTLFKWYRDDQPVDTKAASPRMPGRLVGRDQRWSVIAVPFDGEERGKACQASVRVVNRPPGVPRLELEPRTPTTQDSLTCKLAAPVTDPDGDDVRLTYEWKVDGKSYPVAGCSSCLPAGSLRKGQRIEVCVTAADDELAGKKICTSTRVANSSPGQPNIAIKPEKPLSSEDLRCRLEAPTEDADGDPLEHEFKWFRGGKRGKNRGAKASHSGPKLPAAKTRKGQRWICRAWAHDGVEAGSQAEASVLVENSTPEPPAVQLVPAHPKEGDLLRCKIIRQAQDPDGDRVQYLFRWTKDGVEQSFAAQTDRVPARLTDADDIWQCTVSASDGSSESSPATSNEVVVSR